MSLDLRRQAAAPAALALLSVLGAATADADRTAIYLPGSLPFSPNTTVYAPLAAQDGEPSVRVDVRGNVSTRRNQVARRSRTMFRRV